MPYRVPFLACLHLASAALHRGPTGRPRRVALRQPGTAGPPARRRPLRRLADIPGDPVADHRNILVALWAARRLGLAGADVPRYAREVMLADRAEPGWGDVAAKVAEDLRRAGQDTADHEVGARLAAAHDRVLRALLTPA